MESKFLCVASASLAFLFSGCASVGIGYSGEVITAYGNDRGNERFIKAGNRIGCGSVVSVRKVNQAPMYDNRYEGQFNGTGSSSDIAGAAAQLGVVGIATAVIAGVTTDTALEARRTPKKEIRLANVPKNSGIVKAIQLRLDDGHEVNLPLVDANKFDFSGHYKVGNRYAVYYSPTYDNLQLFPLGEKKSFDSPEQAERYRLLSCSIQLDEKKTADLLDKFAHKVDESKIY